MHKIRKAVIPAAGLGTRFLPATTVVPKEMFPVAGKPLIQFAVEEAIASGIESVILVISKNKNLIPEHFRRNSGLERILDQRGEGDGQARKLSEVIEIQTVVQESPLGLADAIRCVRREVNDEPFAVILPDALIDSVVPATKQLLDCHERQSGCVIATQQVEADEVDRYGIIDAIPMRGSGSSGRTLRVRSLTERPRPGTVSSRYGILGRYVLTPEIFPCIDQTKPGFNGELQLTDALVLYLRSQPLYAYRIEGKHYDAGSQFGYVQAVLDYALQDPELEAPLREHITKLIADPFVSAQAS